MKPKKIKKLFLDVLITRTGHNKLQAAVFRKALHRNLHIKWKYHAPIHWKKGTLKNLTQRSISICSNQKLLKDELNYLRDNFFETND